MFGKKPPRSWNGRVGSFYAFRAAAFSNPRMILKWGWSGKGPALGVDLLSEGVRGGGGKRSRVWP